jgi:hypothetical protein
VIKKLYCFAREIKIIIFTLRINDGVLEVFGIYSSFHIAQLITGIAEPYRIGQAKKVRVSYF